MSEEQAQAVGVAVPARIHLRAALRQGLNAVEQTNAQALLLMFIVALCLVQLGIAGCLYWETDLSTQFGGSTSYRSIAQNLLNKGLYSLDGVHPTAYRPPVYPFFLTALMWLFPHNWAFAAIALQALMGVMVGILSVWVAFSIFRSKLGASFVGILYLLNFQFHIESVRQRETILFTLLLVVFIYLLVQRPKNLLMYIALSVLAALACMTRPTGIFFLPLLLLAIVFEHDRIVMGRTRVMGVVLLVFMGTILPYRVYLYRNFCQLSPLFFQSTAGLILYQGNNPATMRIYPYVDVDKFYPQIQEMLAQEEITDELKASHFLRNQALDYIAQDPTGFLYRAVVKLGAFYAPVRVPLGSGQLVERDGEVLLSDYRSSVWTTASLVHALLTVIMVVGLLGFLVRMWKEPGLRGMPPLLIVCLVALVTLAHMVTLAHTRFRFPVDPLLMILAATFYVSRIQVWLKAVPESSTAHAAIPRI